MKTDYKKLSRRAWDGVKPIKVRTPKDNQVYVNEYIADGSRIGKGSYLLFCRLGNDITVDTRCFAEDYLIVGDNVTFKNYATIGDRCVFGDNAYLHTGGKIGSENEFGDNAKFNKDVRFGKSNIFGDGARFGSNNRFDRWTKIGDNAKVGLQCDFRDVEFGDNAELNHPHLRGNAKFGDGAEIFSPYFDKVGYTTQFGDDGKIYFEEKILSEFRHLLPDPQMIHYGKRNSVILVQKIYLFDRRKTRKDENIKSTYSLEDFLCITKDITK